MFGKKKGGGSTAPTRQKVLVSTHRTQATGPTRTPTPDTGTPTPNVPDTPGTPGTDGTPSTAHPTGHTTTTHPTGVTPHPIGGTPNTTTTDQPTTGQVATHPAQTQQAITPTFRPTPMLRRAVQLPEPPFADKLKADKAFITLQYSSFYDNSGRRRDDYANALSKNYVEMSYFDSPYMMNPSKRSVMNPYIDLERQGLIGLESQDSPWPQALASGDYFHFTNNRRNPSPQNGVRRRIVVNAWSQDSALQVADAMLTQFDDPSVSPFISKFKVLMSFKAMEPVTKADKIVIYYTTDATDPTTDRVGEQIVDTLTGTIPANHLDARLAPFYSVITQGIAWADEAGGASFTTRRDEVMQEVVEENPRLTSETAFYNAVLAKFSQKNVDPSNTHQYVTQQLNAPPGPRAR
ncbi:T3SS effector HopA1 family protein [Nonomuraea sp. NPDC005650]|uniref:T3SS effector HopA1 family protein n=1 Tax=Nonomuraea sp. NPDC005650 TaxID=3157045 RepID=UPI0033A04F39